MRARLDAARETERASTAGDDPTSLAEMDANAATVDDVEPDASAEEPQHGGHPVPDAIRSAAEWAWRLVIIGVAVYFSIQFLWNVRVVVFPVIAALFIAAGLRPLVRRLNGVGFGRSAATATVFIGFLVVVVGTLSVAGGQIGTGFSDVADSAEDGVGEIRDWLINGPLGIQEDTLDNFVERAEQTISDNSDRLTSGAIGAATAAAEVVTGALLGLFTLFFFLHDGERIWRWVVSLFPSRVQPPVRGAGNVAWRTLQGYVRATLAVAFIDFFFITLLLVILRVPLAFPLGVLVFFGAFVPVVGAFVTGALGVLVALVTQGPIIALIVLAGIVAVQQIESHLLQPLIIGRLVRIHPLAVVLSIAVGSLIAGILGAVIAVPTVAVANSVTRYLARGEQPGTPVVSAE